MFDRFKRKPKQPPVPKYDPNRDREVSDGVQVWTGSLKVHEPGSWQKRVENSEASRATHTESKPFSTHRTRGMGGSRFTCRSGRRYR